MDVMEQVKSWMPLRMQELAHFDEIGADSENGVTTVRLVLVTNNYQYSIVVRTDYLGCIAHARLLRPMESWPRGNDLHDGPFSRETWDAIMADIAAYECIAFEVPESESRVAVPEMVG